MGRHRQHQQLAEGHHRGAPAQEDPHPRRRRHHPFRQAAAGARRHDQARHARAQPRDRERPRHRRRHRQGPHRRHPRRHAGLRRLRVQSGDGAGLRGAAGLSLDVPADHRRRRHDHGRRARRADAHHPQQPRGVPGLQHSRQASGRGAAVPHRRHQRDVLPAHHRGQPRRRSASPTRPISRTWCRACATTTSRSTATPTCPAT